MSVAFVSNQSIQASLSSTLISGKNSLSKLSEQLANEKKHIDLTDYAPTDAQNIINIQSAATQRQSYLAVITTVSNNLSTYDTTMTDLETIVQQAQTLANSNSSYDSTKAANIAAIATSYLKAVTGDLNQQVNGRYIYSGTRYSTPPVQDLGTLSTSTLNSTIYSDNATLPSYDTEYAASALTTTIGGAGATLTIGGTVGTPQNVSVTVNSTTYTYTVKSSDTTATITTSLAALIPGATVVSGVLTAQVGDTISAASAYAANTAAYATDSATIDNNYGIRYGISSNNTAFQELIAGLRYLQAAGNSTDATVYKNNVTSASNLLSSALSKLQSLHTDVANNSNIVTTEKNSQNSQITSLTDQLANIQQIDVTQVSTEITSLESILQASYSVTGSILKLSIVSYL